jgi:hypothetical protein
VLGVEGVAEEDLPGEHPMGAFGQDLLRRLAQRRRRPSASRPGGCGCRTWSRLAGPGRGTGRCASASVASSSPCRPLLIVAFTSGQICVCGYRFCARLAECQVLYRAEMQACREGDARPWFLDTIRVRLRWPRWACPRGATREKVTAAYRRAVMALVAGPVFYTPYRSHSRRRQDRSRGMSAGDERRG